MSRSGPLDDTPTLASTCSHGALSGAVFGMIAR